MHNSRADDSTITSIHDEPLRQLLLGLAEVGHYAKTSIHDELLRRPLLSLTEFNRYKGAGVYLLYYRGSGGLYAPISLLDNPSAPPIYAGKAEVPGRSKGADVDVDPATCRALATRLRRHLTSIQKAENLRAEDFAMRCLELPQDWIQMTETAIISRYRPAWNCMLSGFGNNDQGSGRDKTERSAWDKVHPGRPAAMALEIHKEAPGEVLARLECYLAICGQDGATEGVMAA